MNKILNINKLIIVTFLLFTYSNLAYSQKDNLILKFQEQNNEFRSLYKLFISSNISYWKEIDKPSVDENKMNWDVTYVEDENYSRKQVFKDFSNKLIYSNYKIFGHKFYVKEKMEKLNWAIIDSTETILGYNCQIAETKFRGRTYFASFTEDIPISNGPWKFQGLPGIILKVVSNENNEYYKMECLEIKTHDEDIKTTFLDFNEKYKKKFVSWDEFVIDVDDFIKKYIKNLKSSEAAEEGGGYSIKIKLKNQKEIFHKEAQSFGIMVEM